MDVQNVAPATEQIVVETQPALVIEGAPAAMPMEGTMQQSWFEMAHNFFKDKGLPDWASEIAIFGFGCLLLGFLCRSFGRYLVILLLAVVALAVGLHYAQVITLPVAHLQAFFGVSGLSLQEVPAVFFAWAREHLISCVSAVVGFFIGWKLG